MRWVNECKTKQPILRSDSMVLGHCDLINQLIINEILVKLTENPKISKCIATYFIGAGDPWVSNEQKCTLNFYK